MPAMAHLDDVLRERLAALDLERKVRLLTGADFWALHAEPAAGLRRLVTSDGPAGVRGERWDERDPSANVPSPTALAATWDEARIERLGRLLAAECRRKGVDVLLAPTVNLHRTPYGGRHFECFSEDPLLTARIGVAYVRGLQGAGVGATVKHFVANDSETERFTLDARVDERTLRELYLAPFEAIVADAAPWAVMAAYNGVNGHTMTESPLLADVLEGEWGFDGAVMSDWYAARATEPAGNAALDLAMPGPTGPWGDALVAAVRDGRVSEAAVDAKVLRLLRLAARVGALDGIEPAAPAPAPWSDDDVAAELRGAAAASFVLVRNEGDVLPLRREALRRVAVLGPNAAVARTLGGGSATVFPAHTVSPLEGLRAALPGVEVEHAAGAPSHTRIPVAAPGLLGEGVEVRFLGAGGELLGSERRPGAAYAWLGAFGDGVPVGAVTAIEAHARLRAAEGGEHVVGCSGVGRFRLTVGGAVAFDERIELAPGADPAEAHMRPPQRGVPVALEAGEEIDVVLRHELGDGERGTSFEISGAAFQLNVQPPQAPEDEELERAVELARRADVAVVVVGTTEEVESEGFDRESLALPGRQDELVRRVAAANPRTVVVVNSGAPVLLPWAGAVPAVVLAWFGGQEFGDALADVLLGAAEPGGRLPTTWPASEAGLPSTRPVDGVLTYDEGLRVGYRDPDREALYPFGHGLGYTDWEYLGVEVADGDEATARVTLRNAGARRGREVVQVYASRPDSAVERPERWLVGFAIAEADPGEGTTVEIRVPARALAHWDVEAHAWAVEPGSYRLRAGRSSADLRAEADLRAAD
ncbi:MAG: beta-glucosidase [Solirubrobacteraceae bacterium]|jgi:beta-glucosidase|nr:beta-glucosidase [Solirubrobacteraceae bacterium]